MKIQQIRNATIIIEYAGKRFLVDPVLGEKGSFAPFPFSHHQELRNPLHDLPMKAEEIVNNIDCVLLTHLHLDHIDNTAYKLLNKKVHIFVQDEQDRNTVVMDLPTWKSLAKTHVSATSVCQRQKAVTVTGGCSPWQVTPAAMCCVMRQNRSAIWQVTPSGTAEYAKT